MDENVQPCKLVKPENKLISLLKRFDLYLGQLFFGRLLRSMTSFGQTSFKGDLSMKVIRGEQRSRFQKLIDKIRGQS